MEAVNPVLQSAILDKYGKPFAEKTQKIVENLDMTVEKQDVVVEKQDKLGDKIKEVVSNFEGAGTNFSDAFSRSSDGIKELSMGFLDIKGIVEEVGKKFQALGDFFAPIAEIGSFLAVSGVGKKFLGGQGSGTNTLENSREKNRRQELGFFGRMKENFAKLFVGFKSILAKVAMAFKSLFVSMLPLIAKFLLFGGLFAIIAFGIGKLISTLVGWNTLKDTLDGLQNAFDSFILFLNRIGLIDLSDEEIEKREEQKTLRKNNKFLDKQKEKDAKEIAKIESNTDLSEDDKKKEIAKRGLLTGDETVTKTGAILNAEGEIVDVVKDNNIYANIRGGNEAFQDRRLQSQLDMLALESARKLPELQENLDNAKTDKQKKKAQAALDAANNFIAKYNESNEVSAQDKIAQLREEKGPRIGFRDVASMYETDKGYESQEYFDRVKVNSMSNKFIDNASRTGEIIAEQTDRNKTNLLDMAGNKGQIAQVMAPSLTQSISNAYIQQGQPAVAEALSK
jgi:hypothetical protein